MNKILFSSRAAKCAPPRFFAKRFSRRWTQHAAEAFKKWKAKMAIQ